MNITMQAELERPMLPDLILFHAQCPDGSCAAWVALRHVEQERRNGRYNAQRPPGTQIGYVEAVPMLYGKAPPDVRGRRVLIADFSFKRSVLEQMHRDAAEMIVLDHHKTAQADLAGLPYCQFDMQRSGAMMTWDYLNPGMPAPWIVQYVQDRDLWRHELPQAHEISCYMSTLGYTDWAEWSRTADRPREEIATEGRSMLRLKAAEVRQMTDLAIIAQLAGHRIPVATAPVHYSDVAGELALRNPECPFAAAYYQRADGMYVYSLRSRTINRGSDRDPHPPYDVSTVARLYGGGGHAQAAGFSVPHLIHAPVA